MGTALPPEIENVMETLAGKAASTSDSTWINEFITFEEFVSHGVTGTRTHLKNNDLAGLLGKTAGRYTVLQTGPLSNYSMLEDICACLTVELRHYMSPYKGKSLCVCGIGNADLLMDSLGPLVAKQIFPQMPLMSDFENIMAFCPDVNGNTNIKTSTVVSGVATAAGADCILTIDSTNCSNYENLCSSIQLTDAGLQIHGNGERLDLSTIGKPVISIGVPTVIHVNRLAPDAKASDDSFLTVSDIEDAIKRAALVIVCAILQVLHPELDYQTSLQIVTEMML